MFVPFGDFYLFGETNLSFVVDSGGGPILVHVRLRSERSIMFHQILQCFSSTIIQKIPIGFANDFRRW
jgi:hypothetical protein